VYDAARDRLDKPVLDFLESGAGAEWTLTANRAAFDRWAFRPRVLRGTRPPALATSLLGMPLEMPVLTAPFGADRLFHPTGHLAVVGAARDAGVVTIVPEAGSHSLEALAGHAPTAARIFQLHALGDPENFLRLGGRARDAGYQALCVTVDCPTDGWRERNKRNRFQLDYTVVAGHYDAAERRHPSELFGLMTRNDRPVWTWSQLAEVTTEVGLPYLAKGILTADDARAALAAGAAGIYVSNHGGRQIDGVPASLTQLPEIAGAVAGAVPIIVDSGFRRGTDIIKALALGADVVALGRSIAYGLAAGGAGGVAAVLDLLRQEMRTTMTLLGRENLAEVDATVLQRAESRS
jgi:4-hydroxymandelate oxidase